MVHKWTSKVTRGATKWGHGFTMTDRVMVHKPPYASMSVCQAMKRGQQTSRGNGQSVCESVTAGVSRMEIFRLHFPLEMMTGFIQSALEKVI